MARPRVAPVIGGTHEEELVDVGGLDVGLVRDADGEDGEGEHEDEGELVDFSGEHGGPRLVGGRERGVAPARGPPGPGHEGGDDDAGPFEEGELEEHLEESEDAGEGGLVAAVVDGQRHLVRLRVRVRGGVCA